MKRLQPPAPLTRRVSECRMKCGSWLVAAIDLPPSSVSFQYVFSSDAGAGCASAGAAVSANAAAARLHRPILTSLMHPSSGMLLGRPTPPNGLLSLDPM